MRHIDDLRMLAANVPSFSSFYFARNSFTTLPVTLTSFSGTKQPASVKLQWTTENETGFSKFDIEKSADAVQYTTMAAIAATGRPVNHYHTEDRSPVKGNNYYRLKMTDADGSFRYSNIVKINFTGNMSLTLWPNPAADQLVVPEARAADRIVITDAKGSIVLNKMILRQNEALDISRLSAGVYIIQLFSNSNMIRSGFIKQ